VGHTSISNSLLRVKASWVRVFKFSLKLVETQRRVVHVAPTRRSREEQVEDGQVDTTDFIRPFYLKIDVFFILGHMTVLVFYLTS
jgi:hypothetical protein